MKQEADYKDNDDYILQRQICNNAVSAPLTAIQTEAGTIRYFVKKGMIKLPAIKVMASKLNNQVHALSLEKNTAIIREKTFLVTKLIKEITI